jgi:hypothetical protein
MDIAVENRAVLADMPQIPDDGGFPMLELVNQVRHAREFVAGVDVVGGKLEQFRLGVAHHPAKGGVDHPQMVRREVSHEDAVGDFLVQGPELPLAFLGMEPGRFQIREGAQKEGRFLLQLGLGRFKLFDLPP